MRRTTLQHLLHRHLMLTDAPGGDGGGGTGTDGGDAPKVTPGDESDPPDGDGSDDGDGDGQGDDQPPAGDDKAAAKARREAANLRQRLKESETQRQQQLDAIAKALGLKDDEAPDPDALAKDLAATREETGTLRVENAVLRSAQAAGADPEAVLDSQALRSKIAALDPSEDDYRSQVEAVIKEAVQANPRRYALDAPAPAGRSGGQVGGGSAGGDGERSVEDFVKEFNKPRS